MVEINIALGQHCLRTHEAFDMEGEDKVIHEVFFKTTSYIEDRLIVIEEHNV